MLKRSATVPLSTLILTVGFGLKLTRLRDDLFNACDRTKFLVMQGLINNAAAQKAREKLIETCMPLGVKKIMRESEFDSKTLDIHGCFNINLQFKNKVFRGIYVSSTTTLHDINYRKEGSKWIK